MAPCELLVKKGVPSSYYLCVIRRNERSDSIRATITAVDCG